MSDTEAMMWAVEKDPALRSDFCNLTILDHAPGREAAARHARSRARRDPAPRANASSPRRCGIVPPEFADDPSLDLDYHVRRIAVPAPGDTRARARRVRATGREPLDRSRPLWEFTLIEGLADGRAALLQKIHHTITDGVGGLKLSLALVDLEPEPARAPRNPNARNTRPSPEVAGPSTRCAPPSPTPTRRNVDAMCRVAGGTAGALVRPTQLPGRAIDSVRVVRSVRPPGVRRRQRAFGSRRGPLAAPPLRGALGLVAGAEGGRERAGRQRQRRLRHRVSRGPRPLPRAPRQHGGRRCGWRCRSARVAAATTPPIDSCRRGCSSRSNRRRTRGACSPRSTTAWRWPSRNRRSPRWTDSRDWRCSSRPRSSSRFTRNQARTIDFAASNLRGSPLPLYLAGARIDRELSLRAARRDRAERHDARATATTLAHRRQHRPRGDHRRRRVHARHRRRVRRPARLTRAVSGGRADRRTSTTSCHSSASGSRQRRCRQRLPSSTR